MLATLGLGLTPGSNRLRRGGFLAAQPPRRALPDGGLRTGLFAELISGLVAARPEITRVVDIGAGDGRLLGQLADRCADGRLRDLRLCGVDLRPRLAELPDRVDWVQDLWDVRYASWTSGAADAVLAPDGPIMIICAEWLDDLPARSWPGRPTGGARS